MNRRRLIVVMSLKHNIYWFSVIFSFSIFVLNEYENGVVHDVCNVSMLMETDLCMY